MAWKDKFMGLFKKTLDEMKEEDLKELEEKGTGDSEGGIEERLDKVEKTLDGIKDELDALRKENSITKSKAEFLAIGYDDKLAGEAATALADGDMAKFNAAQKSFIENVKKAERAAALAGDPKPPAGRTQTKEK